MVYTGRKKRFLLRLFWMINRLEKGDSVKRTAGFLAFLLFCGSLFGCVSSGNGVSAPSEQSKGAAESPVGTETSSTTATTEAPKRESARVVMIGDSNTEAGHITRPLASLLEDAYGYGGTGFYTFSSLSGQPKTNTLKIDQGDWVSHDVTTPDNAAGTKQIDAPFGLNVVGTQSGSTLTATFYDPGFTLYYLTGPESGTLTLSLNDETIATLDTASDEKRTAKYTYMSEDDGKEKRLKIRLESGTATLFGMETLTARSGGGIVHNWGNASANSQHYFYGDKTIFETGLAALEPTHVVYLIGTNDFVDNATFKTALIEQLTRIKEAVPQTNVLLASTFDIDYEPTKHLMSQYLADAYPDAAAQTGAVYWDMHGFFGPYDPIQMLDGWHCNDLGGSKIARELYRQLFDIQDSLD